MRILFLGAGAIGGYFGGRIAQAHGDVTFLVRADRALQLANGLHIESPLGNAEVDVNTIAAGDFAEHFDIVVLTCKAYGLDEALEAVSSYVQKDTVVVPLLNGFQHLEQVEAKFPNTAVWGGVAQIPATLSYDGTVRHLGSLQGLVVGPRPGQEMTRSKADEFVTLAANAGIDARLGDNIEQDMWDKWVFLATLAAGTCLTRSNVGEILQADQGEALLLGLLSECTEVATKAGFCPDEKRMAGYRGQLTDRSSTGAASMLRDMQQGNPIEAEHIIGNMVKRARSRGTPTPRLDTAWVCLQRHERSRRTAVT